VVGTDAGTVSRAEWGVGTGLRQTPTQTSTHPPAQPTNNCPGVSAAMTHYSLIWGLCAGPASRLDLIGFVGPGPAAWCVCGRLLTVRRLSRRPGSFVRVRPHSS